MQIKTRLLIFTGIWVLSLAGLLSWLAHTQWHEYAISRYAVQDVERTGLALTVFEMVSRERGPTIAILGSPKPAPISQVQALATARSNSEVAIARLRDSTQQVPELEAAGQLAALDRLNSDLAQARARADELIAQSVAERNGDKLDAAMAGMIAIANQTSPIVTRVAQPVERYGTDLNDAIVAARAAAELHEQAGQLGSQFTRALARHEALTPEASTAIDRTMGQIDLRHDEVFTRTVRCCDSPSIAGAMASMDKQYFGRGLNLAGQLRQSWQHNELPTLTTAEFVARYVPPMDSIVQMRDELLQAATQKALANHLVARNNLIWLTLLAVALITLLIAPVIFFGYRLLETLSVSADIIKALAKGQLEVAIPEPKHQDEIGDVMQAIGVLRDNSVRRRNLENEREALVAEQHQTAKELAAHNHSLWLNNQVQEHLGQNASLSQVLDTMLRIIDDYRPGMLGTVLLVADNGKELVGCAAPHLPEAWLSATARIPIEDMSGTAATAVHRGEVVIVEDIATHPYWAAPDFAAFRNAALDLGLRAAWAKPIKNNDGKTLGVLTLYQRKPAIPDAQDRALLADYARLAQLVIERARLAKALQESQALYRLIAENSNDVIWVMQYPAMQYSYISPSIERVYGWTPEEFSSRSPDDPMSPEELRRWHYTLEEHIRLIGEGDLTGCFIELELEVRDKGGHPMPVEVVANIMLDTSSRPTHIIGSTRDISRRKAAEDTIRKMAFFDQLTGLPNRRMMEDRLDQMLALAKREQRTMSLLFVDLDRFKAVNDLHGHAAGDWLLKQVAARMESVLRTSDTASRVGGDEFVILLPDARTTEDAVLVAEKIRCELEQPFVMDNGVELDISSSIGVVMYPDQADNVHDLLHFGDEAMYRAKKGGRNAVEVFSAQAQPDEQCMVYLQWRDEYACGHPEIDDEHQELFRLANDLFRLYTGFGHQPCNAEQMQALDRLLAHLRYHFVHEEQILAASGHEALTSHKVEHATILEHAQRLQMQAQTGEVTLGQLIELVVVEIIDKHFTTETRKEFSVDFLV
jgi:diguanylate cyclase (GGDEF)-like protein/hemerythrin-like metal-binding protein/PAS domain S-box-containing protein